MMYPRLKLLRDLLNEDGVIFVSIDDNEQGYLRTLMDDIFGSDNFKSFIWKKKGGAGNTEKIIGTLTEYILCYFKKRRAGIFNYRNIERDYKYKDEISPYNLEGIEKTNKGTYERKTMMSPIIDPKTGKEFYPKDGMRWTAGKDTVEILIKEKKILFDYKKNRVYIIKRPENYAESENVFYNLFLDVGSLSTAKDELEDLGFERELFDTPKPIALIKRILEISSQKDTIILDSFAGSGTTGHSVLDMNKEDGGNRRFILIEMEDNVAKDITAERVKRAINKYEYLDGFEYCELSKPLFNEEGQIEEECSFEQLANYIYFTETSTNLDKKAIDKYFIGEYNGIKFYLLFKEKGKNILNKDFLKKIPKSNNRKVIYADKCLIDAISLEKLKIQFKQIPYEVKVY